MGYANAYLRLFNFFGWTNVNILTGYIAGWNKISELMKTYGSDNGLSVNNFDIGFSNT